MGRRGRGRGGGAIHRIAAGAGMCRGAPFIGGGGRRLEEEQVPWGEGSKGDKPQDAVRGAGGFQEPWKRKATRNRLLADVGSDWKVRV